MRDNEVRLILLGALFLGGCRTINSKPVLNTPTRLPTTQLIPTISNTSEATDPILSLQSFIEIVKNPERPREITGVYAQGQDTIFALKVVQQPYLNNKPDYGFVDGDHVATQFADTVNIIGLMADVVKPGAGDDLMKLQQGNLVTIINGDGTIEKFVINKDRVILKAIQPFSMTSDFIDDQANILTVEQVWSTFYTNHGEKEEEGITFQTCIIIDGKPSIRWFIQGVKIP